MVARVWLCPYTDAKNGRRESVCTVLLEHDNLKGSVALSVRAPPDTDVVVNGGVTRVMLGKSGEITFSVASSVGHLNIYGLVTGFTYVMVFNGKEISEVQQQTIEALAPFEPTGVAVEIAPDVERKAGTSWYRVNVTANGETHSVLHRFSEFVDVYERVKDAYSGSHLRSNVPAPPKKVINPFTNQLDPDFVEGRRCELHDFVKKLVALPRVLVNPALLDFLEIKMT